MLPVIFFILILGTENKLTRPNIVINSYRYVWKWTKIRPFRSWTEGYFRRSIIIYCSIQVPGSPFVEINVITSDK